VPLPDPLAPDVTEIHDALVAAVQPHPLVEVTATEFVPPLDADDCDVGDTPNEHGAAACVTVTTVPAIVTVPVRVDVVVFGAAE